MCVQEKLFCLDKLFRDLLAKYNEKKFGKEDPGNKMRTCVYRSTFITADSDFRLAGFRRLCQEANNTNFN